MISGQCHLNFAAMSTAIPHVRAGRVRALAVSSAKRSAAAPEYPTVAESGVAGYSHSSWVGFLAPAGTPRAILNRLGAEAVKIARDEQVKSQLLRDGMETVGSTPTEYASLIKSEVARWQKVVKAAGIKPR
jgi:tripartite-type tricarboxylate transporter receptor subunit TctC